MHLSRTSSEGSRKLSWFRRDAGASSRALNSHKKALVLMPSNSTMGGQTRQPQTPPPVPHFPVEEGAALFSCLPSPMTLPQRPLA